MAFEFGRILDELLLPPKRARVMRVALQLLLARHNRRLRMPIQRSNSSFSLTSGSDSDLESLPDYTDDDGTPNTSPLRPKVAFGEARERHVYAPSIFDVPEIVYRIVEYVDAQNTVIPQEGTPIRRRPLLLRHALLTYGDEQKAREVFENSQKQRLQKAKYTEFESAGSSISGISKANYISSIESNCITSKGSNSGENVQTGGSSQSQVFGISGASSPFYTSMGDFFNSFRYSPLYSCLLVNKLFHAVTSEILNRKVAFKSEHQLRVFGHNPSFKKPEVVVFHKLFSTRQSVLMELFQAAAMNTNFDHVHWLEFYMCPKLYPPVELVRLGLQRLVVTGSKVVDDKFLAVVSQRCPGLKVLDIRACELVTDLGVYQIAKHCRKLTSVNLGRKAKGNLITDNSVSRLVQNNRQLITVGLAGCHISDKTIWDLAINCLGTLERLLLNACPLLTNHLVPLILSRRNHYFFRQLSVLELRFNEQITDLVPIIEFKRRQEYRGMSILVEVCELLADRIRALEMEMDRLILQRMFRDILDWVNEADGDNDWREMRKNWDEQEKDQRIRCE